MSKLRPIYSESKFLINLKNSSEFSINRPGSGSTKIFTFCSSAIGKTSFMLSINIFRYFSL